MYDALELDPTGSGTSDRSVLLQAGSSFETQLNAPATKSALAAAGPRRTVSAGQVVDVEGRFSSADSHQWVTYSWRFAMTPPGSQVVLSSTSVPVPSFTPDLPGAYTLVLAASDGSHVTYDSVTFAVSLSGSAPPPPSTPPLLNAYLGPDISADVSFFYTPTIGYTTWTPPLALPELTFTIQDPSGMVDATVQGQPGSLTPPTVQVGTPGYYISSVVNLMGTSSATQVIAAGQPLRYFPSTGFRSFGRTLGVAVGDLSGAGHADVVSAGTNSPSAPQVAIYRNTAGGQYAAPEYLTVGAGGSVALGDFNGDGRLDLAVQDLNTVDIVLQQADGSWGSPQALVLPNGDCTNVAAPLLQGNLMVTADFNHDGRADLAFVDPCNAQAVDVFFSNSDGSFSGFEITAPDNRSVGALIAADLNSDGYVDLVLGLPVASTNTQPEIAVYSGSAGTTLGVPTTYVIPSPAGVFSPVAVCVGDYNRDGRPDLVVGADGGLYLLAQTPTGLSQASPISAAPAVIGSFTSNEPITGLQMLDIDGDQRPDLLIYMSVGSSTPGVLAMRLQQQDGSLGMPLVTYPDQGSTATAAPILADVDGDGRVDLVYAGSSSAVGGSGVMVQFSRAD
jgi:hypothetical protein